MVFKLEDDLIFPPPELADEDGLLAIGGDLSIDRLTLAYKHGIFPWYSQETPILWYSPHKRFVLFPEKVNISKSMRKIVGSNLYDVTENIAFEDVIKSCSRIKRKKQDGTWIIPDMERAYTELHKAGFVHSIEVWQDKLLVGGLYGVQVGKVFCGESMFSKASNASKTALIWLCRNKNYQLIDCQFYTEHLESMGAEFISREEYMQYLAGKP